MGFKCEGKDAMQCAGFRLLGLASMLMPAPSVPRLLLCEYIHYVPMFNVKASARANDDTICSFPSLEASSFLFYTYGDTLVEGK